MHFYNQTNKSKQLTKETSLHIYFIMMRTTEGVWQSIICNTPDDAVQAWKSRKKISTEVGVLHVGFDKPSVEDFRGLVDQYSGRVLITAAAKYILPTSFNTSAQPIAHSGDLAIYLGLRGWGYTIKDITMEADHTFKKSQNWIPSYTEGNPYIANMLNLHKIHNDASYLEHEHKLDPYTRHKLGIYRTYYLVGRQCNDPCELARAAPPWLAQQKLQHLNITTKAYNVLYRNNIQTVADLAGWTLQRLLEEPFFGYKTSYNVLMRLNATLKNAPMLRSQQSLDSHSSNKKGANVTDSSLIESMKNFLLSLNRQEASILMHHLEFNILLQAKPQVTDSHSIEPQSLRYIEIQSIEKMKQNLFWHILIQKITQLLSKRNTPLTITNVETMDLWFKGMSDHQIFFKNLVHLIDKSDINIIKINRTLYLSTINKTTWNGIVKSAKILLQTSADMKWSESKAYLHVQKLLPDEAKEFSHILWAQAARLCEFELNSNATYTRCPDTP